MSLRALKNDTLERKNTHFGIMLTMKQYLCLYNIFYSVNAAVFQTTIPISP